MNEKKGLIITLAVLAVILVAGGAGIYYLQFVILEEKRVELAGLEQQVHAANNKKNQIPKLKADRDALQVKLQDLQPKIPYLDRDEYDRFADLLDQIRQHAGVTVSRGAWQTTAGSSRTNTPSSMHRVVYELNVTGGFYQLLRYINLLEQKKRHIQVSAITVQRGGTEVRRGNFTRELRIQLTSYTYRRPDEENLPTPPVEQVGRSTDFPD